ncbi:MAG: hypothetical protein ACXQT0_02155 [Candidatus Methanofastidiosia archaeon]
MERFFEYVERFSIKIAGKGWHLPAYWALTLGIFPLAEYVYAKRGKDKRRHVFTLCTILLIILAVLLLVHLRLYAIYIVLLVIGRILNFIYVLVGSYSADEKPGGNIFRIFPLFYYFIQSAFKKLYGIYYKAPFIIATLGFGPIVLVLWKKGAAGRAAGVLATIAGLIAFASAGYLYTLIFAVIGALFFLMAYLAKKVGHEEAMTHLLGEKDTFWDRIAITFILIIGVSFAFNVHKFSPNVIDLWYHLAISRKILELGAIPLWDFWEFAPAGRPHLYPPFLHLSIAAIARRPDNVIWGGQVFQALIYPLCLVTTFILARKFFGSKAAALSVFFLSVDMGFMMVSTMALPSCIITMLLPLLILCFTYKKVVPSIAIMTIMLYSHLSFPFVILFALLLVVLKYPEYRKNYVLVAGASIALYMPWLQRVLSNQASLTSTTDQLLSVKWLFIGILSLQIINPILLILGLLAYRHMDNSVPEQRVIKLMLMGTLPILLFYGGRYWIHTTPLWAICIGVYMKDKLSSKRRYALLIALMLVPSISIISTSWPPVSINITGSNAAIMLWTNDDGILFEKHYDEDCEIMADYLEEALDEDAIIHSDIMWVPDMVVTLTNLRTDQGAWWEVASDNESVLPDAYITFTPFENAKKIGRFYIITDKDVIMWILNR